MRIKDWHADDRVLVVAEIGNNHEGDFDLALKMVDEAADAGVDAVKFQTFQTARFVHPGDPQRYERMQRFELAPVQFTKLAARARLRGLLFLSTPLDLESVQSLRGCVDAYKIASGDNNFYPLIRAVAETGLPVIASSGASDLAQVEQCLACLRNVWTKTRPTGEVAVLHCVSNYPTQPAHANLRAIEVLRTTLDCVVGYSDHTLGIEACLLSVALGARIIEKHFTLDKNHSEFRDHQLSADPTEMAELVRGVRRATQLLGTPEKRVLEQEREIAGQIRRSIVAARDLPLGHQIAPEDLMWLRPAGGLRPGEEDLVLGKRLARPIERAQWVTPADVA
jgi:sialic acid synthase SpsE